MTMLANLYLIGVAIATGWYWRGEIDSGGNAATAPLVAAVCGLFWPLWLAIEVVHGIYLEFGHGR